MCRTRVHEGGAEKNAISGVYKRMRTTCTRMVAAEMEKNRIKNIEEKLVRLGDEYDVAV